MMGAGKVLGAAIVFSERIHADIKLHTQNRIGRPMFIREYTWMIRVVCVPAVIGKCSEEIFCWFQGGNDGRMTEVDVTGLHEFLHDP